MKNMLSGRRILVVEDEALIRMTLEDVLADMGCESVTATATADQGVALVQSQFFDAALLDINLNGGTSRSVADALSARNVPFVFATATAAMCGTTSATAPFFASLSGMTTWSRFWRVFYLADRLDFLFFDVRWC